MNQKEEKLYFVSGGDEHCRIYGGVVRLIYLW